MFQIAHKNDSSTRRERIFIHMYILCIVRKYFERLPLSSLLQIEVFVTIWLVVARLMIWSIKINKESN